MDRKEYNKLDQGTKRLVDWQMGRTGAFWTLMFEAMNRADGQNLDRLQEAFPEEVLAYRSYSQGTEKDANWWRSLRQQLRIGVRALKERVGKVG